MFTQGVIMPTTTGPRASADSGRSKTNMDLGALVMCEMKGIAVAGGDGAVGLICPRQHSIAGLLAQNNVDNR